MELIKQSYERDRMKYVTNDIIATSCCHAMQRVLDTNVRSAFTTQTGLLLATLDGAANTLLYVIGLCASRG